jgi:hypothetical protein
MRRGLLLGVAIMALSPAGAQASMTFGSDLSLPADSLSSQCAPASPPCTFLLTRTHPGNAFPARAPVSGLVTSFGIRAGAAETVTFRLGRVADVPGSPGAGVATGPTVSLKSPGIYSFPASLWVHQGDSVGIDSSSTASFSIEPACDATVLVYSPPLPNGGGPVPAAANATCEWLVNAVFEPSPRALALKRCARKHAKAKRRACRKRARKLPVLPG